MISSKNMKCLSFAVIATVLSGCGVAQHAYVESLSDQNRFAFLSDKTDQEICRGYTNSLIKEKTTDATIQELQKRGVGLCITYLGVRAVPGGGERTVRNTEIPEFNTDFLEGKADLTCTTLSCNWEWGSVRGRLKELHALGQWHELAKEVLNANLPSDQGFYYLGKASEGLGAPNAALEYYAKALKNSHKCAGVLNNCDGLDIPKLAKERVAMIQDSINGSTVWSSLNNSQDEEGVVKFLSDFPKSTHINAAQMHLRWLQLQKSQSLNDFLSYLKDFPGSERSSEVATRALALAQKINNLETYLELAKSNQDIRALALNGAKSILDPKIKSLEISGNCAEAEKLVEKMNYIETGFHPFSKQKCERELLLSQIKKSKDPKALYFNAVKLEDVQEFELAREAYRTIIEKFSADPFALRAADRLLAVNERIDAMKREEAAREKAQAEARERELRETRERLRQRAQDALNDREAQAAKRRADEAARLQRSTCQAARQTCLNSCSGIQDRRQKNRCESQCGYCN